MKEESLNIVEKLTLLQAYLTGWKKIPRNERQNGVFMSWRGFSCEILSDLERKELIRTTDSLIVLTDEGLKLAEKLKVNHEKCMSQTEQTETIKSFLDTFQNLSKRKLIASLQIRVDSTNPGVLDDEPVFFEFDGTNIIKVIDVLYKTIMSYVKPKPVTNLSDILQCLSEHAKSYFDESED